MLLGYTLICSDISCRLLGDNFLHAPPNPCNNYLSIYDINYIPDNFKMPKKKHDFFETMDGFLLVSERVRRFCVSNKYRHLEFVKLKSYKYYWLKSNNVIEFDHKTRGTLFLGYSKKCKGYKEVVGAHPVCLIDKRPLSDNFHRTDICFGDEDTKSPVNCVGIRTYEKIRSLGFKGVNFDKILDTYESIPKVY